MLTPYIYCINEWSFSSYTSFRKILCRKGFFLNTHTSTTLAKSNTYAFPIDLHTNEIFCLNVCGFMRQPRSFMSRNNTECIKTLAFEKNGRKVGKKWDHPTKGYLTDFSHKTAVSKRKKGCTLWKRSVLPLLWLRLPLFLLSILQWMRNLRERKRCCHIVIPWIIALKLVC